MNALIEEARKKGFKKGASCLLKGDLRIMTSNKIVEYNGNLLAMGAHPFFIRFKNKWCAEVMKKCRPNVVKNH